jgi:hypothetical protein
MPGYYTNKLKRRTSPRLLRSRPYSYQGVTGHNVDVAFIYAAPEDFAVRKASRSRMLMPESSNEIISSGVTPTCCP